MLPSSTSINCARKWKAKVLPIHVAFRLFIEHTAKRLQTRAKNRLAIYQLSIRTNTSAWYELSKCTMPDALESRLSVRTLYCMGI